MITSSSRPHSSGGWSLALLLAASGCTWGTGPSQNNGGGPLGPGMSSDPGTPGNPLPGDGSDLPGGPPKLSGTRIVADEDLQLLEMMEDDHVLYTFGDALRAISLDGGMPATIDTGWQFERTAHNVVFTWKQVSTATNTGSLNVWTSAAGLKTLTQSSSTNAVPAVSKDGSRIAYPANVTSDGKLADWYLAKSDGSAAVKVATQKSVALPCIPKAQFVANRLVLGYCDAGATAFTVVAADATTGTTTTVATGLLEFGADDAGTAVYGIDNIGLLKLTALNGGNATQIDIDTNNFEANADGSKIFYTTDLGALKRASVTAPNAPVTVAAAGVTKVDVVSPDGARVLGHQRESTVNKDLVLTDIQLVASGAGGPKTIVAAAEAYMPAFSSDGSAVLYASKPFALTDNVIGYTLSRALVGGGAPATLSATAIDSFPLARNSVLVVDNEKKTSTIRFDVRVVDLGGMANAQLIASRVDATVLLSRAKDRVVYLYSATPGEAGIYVATLQ